MWDAADGRLPPGRQRHPRRHQLPAGRRSKGAAVPRRRHAAQGGGHSAAAGVHGRCCRHC